MFCRILRPDGCAAMARHDVIVIGASAGGVEAISRVVADLPRDIRASILVVLHISLGRSLLPEILTRAGRLPAAHPADQEPLQYGRIYVAPPDLHLLVQPGAVRVVHSASENGVRPAVDPLFRSAARAYGPRVVGVILTGTLDDGTAGMVAVKEAGGVTIAQEPDEAFAPGMPRSAIRTGAVDHVVPLRDIPLLLAALSEEDAAMPAARPAGPPSVFTCPECHGTLWEADEGGLLRFRCRVGHIYSPDSMLSAQTDEVDRALWVALRTLEERAALAYRLAERARARQQQWVERAFSKRGHDAEREAGQIRALLRARGIATHSVPDGGAADAGRPGDPSQPESEAAVMPAERPGPSPGSRR